MKKLIIPLIIIGLIAALIAAQEDETTDLMLSVAGEHCALELLEINPEATPEITPEPETTPEPAHPEWLRGLPSYTLSDDCENLDRLLTVPSNGTLWLALLLEDAPPGSDDDWLPLDTLEDDPYPPQLDGRGRYFGCAIPVEGEQVCYVLVTLDEVDYLVEVPLWVGDAYFAPEPTTTEESEAQNTPEQQSGGNQPQSTQVPQPTQVPDSDGDGLTDDVDECPFSGGPPSNNGCPPGGGPD